MICVSDINETILRAIKTIKNEKMKMFRKKRQEMQAMRHENYSFFFGELVRANKNF